MDRLQLTDEPTLVAEQVFRNAAIGLGDYTASATGVLAYRSGAPRMNQFAWVDRTGRQMETVGPPGSYRTHAMSPDGTRLAYTDTNDQNLWIFDLTRKSLSRFTSMRGIETSPVWSLDGQRIAFRADAGGGSVYRRTSSGATPEHLLLNQMINGPSQSSPDGSCCCIRAGEGWRKPRRLRVAIGRSSCPQSRPRVAGRRDRAAVVPRRPMAGVRIEREWT